MRAAHSATRGEMSLLATPRTSGLGQVSDSSNSPDPPPGPEGEVVLRHHRRVRMGAVALQDNKLDLDAPPQP